MSDSDKTKEQLVQELGQARQRIADLEALEAQRAQAQRDLENAEWEKKIILDSQQDHVVYQDAKHKILWVNQAACDSVNMTREELIGRYCYQVWAGLDERCEDCPVAEAIKTGQPQATEKTTPDGRAWFVRGYPVRDLQGNIVGGIETTQNITQRLQTEARLKELEHVVNLSPAVYFIWRADEGWPVEFVSENVRQFGYTPEDFYSGRVPYASIIYPDDLERVAAEVSDYSQEEGRADFAQEYRVVTQAGEVRWTDDHTWIRRDAKGAITHYQGLVMDSTRQKQTEQKLREAEAKFREIVERSLVGIFRTSPDGFVIEANPSLLNMLGFDSVEDMNEVGLPNLYVDPDKRQEMLQLLQQQGRLTGFELDVRSKEGAVLQLVMNAQLMLDEAGQPAFLEGMLEDVSERVRVEAERERLQQQLIEAQQRTLRELSTPIIPILDAPGGAGGILVMPLVGDVDSKRARDIMRALLAGIRERRASVVILDITGVPLVDSGVANHLNKTIRAAQLKGAQTIITGISEDVAEAIVDLGIDWSKLETLGDLQTGLVVALNKLGLKLVQS
jgi:PAS domain S-box-containing protein